MGGAEVTTDSPALAPCPFCGEVLNVTHSRLATHSQHSKCFLRVNGVDIDDPDQVAAWNCRSASAPAGGGDFADAEAARRLRDRLAREVARLVGDSNMRAAEDEAHQSAWTFLNGIVEHEEEGKSNG